VSMKYSVDPTILLESHESTKVVSPMQSLDNHVSSFLRLFLGNFWHMVFTDVFSIFN
jgi:hypothetical protein